MSFLWWLLIMFIVAVWVVSILDLIHRRDKMSTGRLIAWLAAIVIFPVLGTLVYFLARDVFGRPDVPQDPMSGELS